jgi:hypothetical protein
MVVDPFWQEVAWAYDLIAKHSDPTQQATVELNGKRAVLSYSEWSGSIQVGPYVQVLVSEVPVQKPTLITP